jgi:hypothetical protein
MSDYDITKLNGRFAEVVAPVKGKPANITYQELESIIAKWLVLADPCVIKVLTATMIVARMNTDPFWLMLIAPSGGSKTELISALNGIRGVYQMSELTAQTFISGLKDANRASLLDRIDEDNAVLTFKDFTTVLEMRKDSRKIILSQLREIYDGEFRREFGIDQKREWIGKVGFIAGVTPVIDQYQVLYQSLGERFLQLRIIQPKDEVLANKAMDNVGKEKEMRSEIMNAFAGYIENVVIPEKYNPIDSNTRNKIILLAKYCAVARTSVKRDAYYRDISSTPIVESSTRIVKQLTSLYHALVLIGNKPQECLDIIYRVCLDSMPANRKQVLDTLLKSDSAGCKLNVFTEHFRFKDASIRRILEDMTMLNLIDIIPDKVNGDTWVLSNQSIEVLASESLMISDIEGKQ